MGESPPTEWRKPGPTHPKVICIDWFHSYKILENLNIYSDSGFLEMGVEVGVDYKEAQEKL